MYVFWWMIFCLQILQKYIGILKIILFARWQIWKSYKINAGSLQSSNGSEVWVWVWGLHLSQFMHAQFGGTHAEAFSSNGGSKSKCICNTWSFPQEVMGAIWSWQWRWVPVFPLDSFSFALLCVFLEHDWPVGYWKDVGTLRLFM